MFCDYHVHSLYSYDGTVPPEDYIAQALKMGLEEICFTEHIDLDHEISRRFRPVIFDNYVPAIQNLRKKPLKLRIRMGIEAALGDEDATKRTLKAISGQPLDFIIGSVHVVNGEDTYEPEYFENRSKELAYRIYFEQIAACVKRADYFNVLGHFDYVAKNAPYTDRTVSYSQAPDVFDEIFAAIIPKGIGIEINTSVYKQPGMPLWGEDIFKRYAQMGGEYITIGSDTHSLERLGYLNREAREMAKRAGIKYLATFENLKPTFHKL